MTDQDIKKEETKTKELYERNREFILQLVKDGKLPEPRKLTRSERRKLDAAKANMFKLYPEDKRGYFEVKENCADWIMDNIYKDFDFSKLDNNVCLWFGEYIFGLSYRNDLAEKN